MSRSVAKKKSSDPAADTSARKHLLRRRLGSRHVESHVLERSWHVVTEDVERDEVGRLAVDFLTRVEAA